MSGIGEMERTTDNDGRRECECKQSRTATLAHITCTKSGTDDPVHDGEHTDGKVDEKQR